VVCEYKISACFLPTWLCQIPPYTYSGKKRAANVDSESGIGWSTAGVEKYNSLYELVIKDREARGVAFNDTLLVYYLERRQNKKSKPDRSVDAVNRKAILRDDLHTFDASSQNVLVPEFTQKFNSAQV
jgi:hypothetical protein